MAAQLTLSLPTEPGDSDRAVAAGIGDALQRALTIHAARRLAEERSARQAAVAAAARSVHGQLDGMLRGVAEAARGALEADAAVIYTLGADGPVALEAVGTGLPDACDGVAAQAIATARSVVDADGRFLASAPGELACGVAVPLPGGGERGAISALYRAKRPLGERDAEDLAAFAQIAALAIDRATLERELDRREVLRAGFVEITDALAGTREPAETYSAVASAARRALRASAAVVVTESDGLRASGSAPTMPALVDDAGQAGALLQLAAREGRIVLCTDASSDRRVSGAERRRLLETGQRSALCIPVVSPAGLAAVLGVVWPEAHAASDDDLDLARHLGTAAAAAIERAETLASERQARARAQELQRIGGLMASNLDAAAVLREIVSQAALLLNADSCALRLVEGDRLVVRAVQGEAAELLAGEQAPITGGPTGEVLARRTPVAVADMAADDRFLPDDPLVQAPVRGLPGCADPVARRRPARRAGAVRPAPPGVEARRARGARGVRQLRHRGTPERPSVPARRAGEGEVRGHHRVDRRRHRGGRRRLADRDVEPRHVDHDRRLVPRRPAPHAARAAARRARRPRRRGARRRCRRRPRPAAASRCGSRGASARSGCRPARPSCATRSRTGSAPSTRCATCPRTASSTSSSPTSSRRCRTSCARR